MSRRFRWSVVLACIANVVLAACAPHQQRASLAPSITGPVQAESPLASKRDTSIEMRVAVAALKLDAALQTADTAALIRILRPDATLTTPTRIVLRGDS